jgi:hypothetical protein
MPASRFAAWAGVSAEILVTRVTGVTKAPNPSTSGTLKDATEVTQAAEPTVTRVTGASPDEGVTQVTPHPMPGLPRNHVDDQTSNPGNPSNPGSNEWRDLFEKRAAIRELDGQRSCAEAERLAFGDAILEWHRRHGARPDSRRCAGCDDELPGEGGVSLCDGARLHLDGVRGVDCIIAYGHRWRSAAVAALQTLGVDPPAGFELL